ncbi:MAG: DUF2282 domain-containing protein [Rhodovibrionaceae bacterium]
MFDKKFSATTAAFALASAVAVGGLSLAPAALAADGVKCYGIAKAGENDCANAAGTHSCAGHATKDFDGGDWKAVESEAACTEAKGQLEPFEGMNEMKSS